MKPRVHAPRRLDVAAFAAQGAALAGSWPLAGFERLADGRTQPGQAEWSVSGQLKPVVGGEAEVWLHLEARAQVQRECQRCLQPVALDLEVRLALRFVADEDQAAALDAQCEDDVLALSRNFDLHALLEDELLLALPLVPMHADCPQPLPVPLGAAAVEATRKPFAGLGELRRGHKA